MILESGPGHVQGQEKLSYTEEGTSLSIEPAQYSQRAWQGRAGQAIIKFHGFSIARAPERLQDKSPWQETDHCMEGLEA